MSIDHLARFTHFAAGGGLGWVIEAILLTWRAKQAGVNLYVSRATSFAAAVTATWTTNRRFTFARLVSGRKTREYTGYLAVQAVGTLINLGVFVVVVSAWSWMRAVPVAALAIRASVALLFNFIASRLLGFQDIPDGARRV